MTSTFNEIDSSTSSTTGNTYNQDNAPGYINVNGQGEFNLTITSSKDGLIDITILHLRVKILTGISMNLVILKLI